MATFNTAGTGDFPSLDAKARAHLEKKLSKVHKSVFTEAINPITIDDVYRDADAIEIPAIPKQFQLDFFFQNFNNIARGGYRPHSSKSLDVNRAIWYYEVSKQHTLASRIDVVRHNIVVMAFVMIAKKMNLDTSDLYEPGAEVFFEAYIEAWLSKTCGDEREHALQEELVRTWMSSGFDLVTFPERARRDMYAAIWNLQQMVSDTLV